MPFFRLRSVGDDLHRRLFPRGGQTSALGLHGQATGVGGASGKRLCKARFTRHFEMGFS